MRKVGAERYRDIDFSGAKRGPVARPEPGKTKISIRLDNTILDYFRNMVDEAGGGNYQTLINDALLEYVHRRSTLEMVREVVREELSPYRDGRESGARMKSRAKEGQGRSAKRRAELSNLCGRRYGAMHLAECSATPVPFSVPRVRHR